MYHEMCKCRRLMLGRKQEDTMSKSIWILPIIAGVLFGCATAPNVSIASATDDAAAKTFTPRAGKTNLYIAQSNNQGGNAATFDIIVDGKRMGPIGPGIFYLVEIEPGKHTIMASSSLKFSENDRRC